MLSEKQIQEWLQAEELLLYDYVKLKPDIDVKWPDMLSRFVLYNERVLQSRTIVSVLNRVLKGFHDV